MLGARPLGPGGIWWLSTFVTDHKRNVQQLSGPTASLSGSGPPGAYSMDPGGADRLNQAIALDLAHKTPLDDSAAGSVF